MKKVKYYDIIFIILFMLTLFFLNYKLHYGYFYNDEPYILSLGYRFAKGDIMFAHDWSLGVLTGFLVYPFAKIYTIFNSSNEGILIFGRYCYLILWSLTVLFVYLSLRKYKLFNAFACISLFLFAPLDMMTLSYNSFCLIGLVVCSVIIVNAKSYIYYILAGFFFSISVLSIPYMVFVYIIFSFIMILNIFIKKIKMPNNLDLFKSWLFFTIGCGINVILLIIFIFSKGDFEKVITGINNIMYGNTEHEILGPFSLLFKYFFEFSQRFKIYTLLSFILLITVIFDRKRLSHKIIYLFTALLIIFFTFINLWNLKDIYPNLNLTVIPFSVMGILVYVISDKKDNDIFIYFIILGLIYSLVFLQASNLGLPALATSFILITFGSLLLLDKIYEKGNIFIRVIIIISVFIQIVFQFSIRYINYYQDETIDKLIGKIEVGPGKGIYTNINDKNYHDYIYEQINWFLEDVDESDVLLVTDSAPWMYFLSKAKIGTYSTWGSWNDPVGTVNINIIYYDVNPDRYPNYIVINKKDLTELEFFIRELQEKKYKTKEAYDFVLYYLN